MEKTIRSRKKVLYKKKKTNKFLFIGSRPRPLQPSGCWVQPENTNKVFYAPMNPKIINIFKKFYRWLDNEVNLREQAIGWSAVTLTLIVCWNILKYLSNHPEIIKTILRYWGVG